MNGLTAIARILVVVFRPLVRIVVFPLTEHAPYVKSRIDKHLVPRKHLMRVNIPVLHPLNPIYAALVIAECFGNVLSFFIVIGHVWIEFSHAIGDRSCKQSFDDVRTNVVHVFSIIIDRAAEIIHVHDLASCLCATVLVEQGVESCCSRNRYNCRQVLASVHCCLPLSRAFVRLAIQAHFTVRPLLLAQPFYSLVNAPAFPFATIIKTTR